MFGQENLNFGFDWILIIISAIAILAFHISVFILLFYSMRVYLKLKGIRESKEEDKPNREIEKSK